jgi:hypothetical protein
MEEDRKMPVTLPDVKKTWPNAINTVTLGATRDEGGTPHKEGHRGRGNGPAVPSL